jgi:hypothetical protein
VVSARCTGPLVRYSQRQRACAAQLLAGVEPEHWWVSRVAPAQNAISWREGDTPYGDESELVLGAFDQRGICPAEQPRRIVRERRRSRKHRANERRPACRLQALADHVPHDQCRRFAWPLRDEVEVSAHSLRCRKERRGELDAGSAGQLGRCQCIANGAQVVELTLVGEQPLEQPVNHVIVNSRFTSQALDESAQIAVAAVKLLRLNSKLGKFTTRLRRRVAKSRDLLLLLAGLSTKPSELPVG